MFIENNWIMMGDLTPAGVICKRGDSFFYKHLFSPRSVIESLSNDLKGTLPTYDTVTNPGLFCVL